MEKENATIQSAALYIRVSTDKQEELSPDSQKRLLLDYAKAHGMIVSNEHIYTEKGISGRHADKRPEFQRMIATAKSDEHPFDVILLWKFSRFARNQEESIVYKSMLRNKYHVDVVSISEPLIEGPFGELIERIIEWMDEFYSIRLSGDVMRGMTENALRGTYQCRPPLGYRIPYHKATPEIVPEEAEIVRLIFNKYVAENISPYGLARYLNEHGYQTSRGKRFETRSIEYILLNPGYAGDIRWNRVENATKRIKDSSEWIIRSGHHPAIISKELFLQAQEKYYSTYKPKNKKPSEITKHWLSGMIKCSGCGRTLSSSIQHNKKSDTYVFQCYGYLKGKCNTNSRVLERNIVPAVIKALEDVLKSGSVSYTIRRRESKSNGTDELSQIEKQLSRLGQKEARIKEAYMAGIDTIDEYRSNKESINAERTRLESQKEQLSKPLEYNEDSNKKMLQNISSLLEIIKSDDFSMQEKNVALRSVVEKITYNRALSHIDVDFYLSETPKLLK